MLLLLPLSPLTRLQVLVLGALSSLCNVPISYYLAGTTAEGCTRFAAVDGIEGVVVNASSGGGGDGGGGRACTAAEVAAADERKLAAYNVLNVCWLLATLPTVSMLRHYTKHFFGAEERAGEGEGGAAGADEEAKARP